MAEKEYIEREALIDKTSDIRVNGNPYRVIFYDDVILAPAADVSKVIRCKNCVYMKKAKVNKKGFMICPASGMEITDNDYCSYAEEVND